MEIRRVDAAPDVFVHKIHRRTQTEIRLGWTSCRRYLQKMLISSTKDTKGAKESLDRIQVQVPISFVHVVFLI